MILHDYFSSSGKNMIMEYIDNLTEDEQTDAHSVRQLMQEGRFEEIRFKPWQKKVYEVYFQKHNRMFYIVTDSENIYIIHVCRKQKNKTEKKDVKIIQKRAKELGAELGKKFI